MIRGFQHARLNAPRVGGGLAVWGGLFSAFDCSLVYLRQKEDHYNPVIAGALTGGLLQMRQGLRADAKGVVFGAIVLAMMEGVVMSNKLEKSEMENRQHREAEDAQRQSVEESLGGGGNQVDKDLDGFLKPSPPIQQDNQQSLPKETYRSEYHDDDNVNMEPQQSTNLQLHINSATHKERSPRNASLVNVSPPSITLAISNSFLLLRRN
ncbi:Mitochondrial import inner membrane translocase subunit tim17 [Thalictrum thalictroides]|uniref:Mitochondrial import inner membrane translocase subunit tim17 n=1 Tax=Thalictrum thalictroides TaxID=46969 RepID=A0A7J6X2Q6_THATH|nr:Mitochondrial import inner membrane translocase subunit tim17 [Thalictrum thalictroides]